MAKQTTLQELLKRLPTFKSAFKDTTKTKGYRIKAFQPLSNEDLDLLQRSTQGNKDVVSIDNNYEWKSTVELPDGKLVEPRFVFLITLSKAPTKIIVRDLKS